MSITLAFNTKKIILCIYCKIIFFHPNLSQLLHNSSKISCKQVLFPKFYVYLILHYHNYEHSQVLSQIVPIKIIIYASFIYTLPASQSHLLVKSTNQWHNVNSWYTTFSIATAKPSSNYEIFIRKQKELGKRTLQCQKNLYTPTATLFIKFTY